MNIGKSTTKLKPNHLSDPEHDVNNAFSFCVSVTSLNQTDASTHARKYSIRVCKVRPTELLSPDALTEGRKHM